MKLIKEINEDVEIITESSGTEGAKNYFIEGIIMQGEVKNRNGRIYPKEILMREMARYKSELVEKKRAYGELGHPVGPSINLDRVSHMFTELKEDGNNVIGKAKILDTPMGKIVKNFIDEQATLGISSRGLGTLKANKSGIMEVQNDFYLATAGDIVSDPSGPNCFINGIMENQEFYYDIAEGWVAKKVLEDTIKEVDANYSKIDEKRAFELFEAFIGSLKRERT